MTLTMTDASIESPKIRYKRKDSNWTAEVVSIGIAIDYVMDLASECPASLVKDRLPATLEELNAEDDSMADGESKTCLSLSDDGGNGYGTHCTSPSMDALKNGRIAEIGIVLPMVSIAGQQDDEGTNNVYEQDKANDDHKDDQPVAPDNHGDDREADRPKDQDPEDKPPPEPEPDDETNFPPRDHWENKFQFLLSIIGYAVDLSNVWRFPFLCYKNGGGAFLIPYFTTLIFGAMPVFFMEMCIGQFHRRGPISAWERMTPMFKGIGMASCFMAYIVAFYYNIIIGWSFFYLFSSFSISLPWTSCFNDFNSDNCWQIDWTTAQDEDVDNYNSSSSSNSGGGINASRVNGISYGDSHYNQGIVIADGDDAAVKYRVDHRTMPNRTYNVSTSVSSTMEFFERGMLELHQSSGLDDLGGIRWQLALCTLLTFTLLYFCLWKGVKSTGKVVYVTATLPYVIMSILLVRGVLLPGAGDGIRYFITPKIQSLKDPEVWIDAAVQIFFSVGSGFGTHIAYASYNKFNNNCKRDCIITVVVNSFTSLFSGFVIFSYLGYMSLKTHKDIDKVATEGPGLVFIVYPEAIATLPGSVGWAIIFFFMLLALGLDSAFGGLESPLTGLKDELVTLMKFRYFREALTLTLIVSAYIFSLPCLTQGGMYVFTILDTFAAGTSIVFVVLCEVVVVSWFYGMPQFCKDVEKMTGERPSLFWRVCWKYICPLLLTIIVVFSIISYQPLSYVSGDGVYTYPGYANWLGWGIALSSMLMVPGYALYKLLSTPGTFRQRLALGISPKWEHNDIKHTKFAKRFQKRHWLSI